MFNWKDYIDFGEKLLKGNNTAECDQRIAISRIYYGLFNLAKAKMSPARLKDLKDLRDDSNQQMGFHQLFWRQFFDSDKEVMNTDVLRSARNLADYNSSSYKFDEEYERYIKIYKDVQKAIENTDYIY